MTAYPGNYPENGVLSGLAVIPPELQRPVLDTPETDPLPASANVQYVGPVVWQRSDSSLPEWVQRSPEKPIIWVYSGNPRYAPVPTPIDSIVVIRAAIASLGRRTCVRGAYDWLPGLEFEALPANFFHAAHLPGHSMAAHCDLMVHHGGYRSVMTGLQSGTPAAAARVFKVEFRIAVAQRILNGESVSSLSSQYKIKRSVLYRWRDAYRDKGKAGFGQPEGRRPGPKRNAIAKSSNTADERIVELERRLGRMALENDFLRRAFKRVKEARSKSNAPGEARCTEK